MTNPIAILGPTGYTGLELIEIIARHPSLRIEYLASARSPRPCIDQEFPRLRGRMGGANPQCEPIDHDAIAKRCAGGLAFLCLPHEAAMAHTPELLARGLRVVDLSAAYRIRDRAAYEKAYGHPHTDAANLDHAVYGLTEFAREQVTKARLVANPGCYPTAAAISLLPLLRAGLIEPTSIIINAASGVSGAGREPKPHTTLVEAGENYSAYGIGTHRHQPEINQTLHLHGNSPKEANGGVLFVPHLLPVERGILETIYAQPIGQHVDTARVTEVLAHAYAGERFVGVRPDAPTLRDVARTNRVHVNARVVGGRVVIVAAIDNLVKGASGQAVQNANLMLGLDESAGLT
ncbi:MAG TPA: N-acetyl-gamma-glutamyl-phosphate reductase [Phycisphaerales bacterium]|nr:N-acetyl-gamma-glutamyl-phosphate reductase [Phycisphaerales bacterium]